MAVISKIKKILTSIRWQLVLLICIFAAAALIIAGVIAAHIVEENLIAQRVDEMTQEVSNISTQFAPYLHDKDADSLYTQSIEAGRELSGRVLIMNSSGVVQVDSFSILNGQKLYFNEIYDVLSGASDSAYGFHKINKGLSNEFWSIYYTSAIVYDSKTIGVVLFSESVQDVADKILYINGQLILVFALACIFVALATLIISNHITKPINKLREAALQIAKGDFKERVNVKGRNEIAELGDAFNIMSAKLSNVDRQRSEFVSNASHELKTPMTSMKILVESILYQDNVDESVYKEFLGDINSEIDRLTNLINDLLLITKLDNEASSLNIERVDLKAMLEQTVSYLRVIANLKNITINVTVDDVVEADCDEMRIRQAMNNLIDNAIKYTGEGGRIDITLNTSAGHAVLSVKDNGIGISEIDLPHIFDRFYRVDKARSRETGGTGLGLHIVKKIALLHNGSVDVKSEKGEGSEFIMSIPVEYIRNDKQEIIG